MSSIDSSVLSASSMAAWNVYRPLVEPDATSARLTWVVKRAVIVVGIAATLMALHVRSIYTLWVLCSDLVYCILFPQLLLALKDPKANRLGSYAGNGRVVRSAHRRASRCSACRCCCRCLSTSGGAPTVPIKTIAMLAGLVTMWAVSRWTAERCPAVPLSPVSA